ncbi:uncharacterized protein LOC127253293 [Andrographis paniculata]|uniref:uncharacterized protein LOC127253293 n=1 Tax=Andrographis paniculata TaxID=175694 RepID=UPI0021E97BF8|nr:uncharacterized protein LOC127253293 [Andrographis paniculata]XP_051133765.1 uncharacterized protein LOC127253293 [Andrographis paniculata]
MPSGSKKRKAAKKKKENRPGNHQDPSSLASGQSHGTDDVKHQDDKHSDVGEVDSPAAASQDLHGHSNVLAEGVQEVIHDEKITSDNKPEEGVKTEAVEEANVVSAEREVRIEDDYNKKDDRFEHEETTKRSYDGGSSRSSRSSSSSSSSSSSDDESSSIKSSQAAKDIPPLLDSATVPNSLSESKTKTDDGVAIEDAGDSIANNVSVVLDRVEMNISSLENSPLSQVKSVIEETEEKKMSSFEDTSVALTLDPKEEETIQSTEQVATISDPTVYVPQPTEKVATVSDPTVCESTEKAATISDPTVCESTDEKVATISDQTVCVLSQSTEDQLMVSYNVPVAAGKNEAEHVSNSGVTEPVVHTAPRPVQTTSWKSCCGLFELFTGSGR